MTDSETLTKNKEIKINEKENLRQLLCFVSFSYLEIFLFIQSTGKLFYSTLTKKNPTAKEFINSLQAGLGSSN